MRPGHHDGRKDVATAAPPSLARVIYDDTDLHSVFIGQAILLLFSARLRRSKRAAHRHKNEAAMKKPNTVLLYWAAIAATAACGIGLVMGQTGKEAGSGQLPFANAVDQRNEIIVELKQIRQLLKDQNEFLRTLVKKP